MMDVYRLPVFLALVSLVMFGSAFGKPEDGKKNVTYDGRSMMINGERVLLFSGSIHYPRSPPEAWLDIIRKAKAGGLNVIQTYVFWNLHEPIQGQFNFTGNKDLVKFIKLIKDEGMYVTLRIGPYIEAEWNFGGFPYWLKEVPGITFRTDNGPFKEHMERWSKRIVDMMKFEQLFAPQGGPIIMTQIENEYTNVQAAYKEMGKSYIDWAANMANGLGTGVPWIMCKQKQAPDNVLITCNGRHCGDTFVGPGPNKPSLWTENWTAQYRVFGDPPSQRTAEDIAYSVTRFFSRNGTLTNYYMYHGGTNFGRTSSSFVTTRYYDEAPLDEYALPREPKFGHIRDLHTALKLSKKALLTGTPSTETINDDIEVQIYEKPGSDICAAFLTNNNSQDSATFMFRKREYTLPKKSISILPDCKTVVYNTRSIVAQHNSRNFQKSEKVNKLEWEMFSEFVPDVNQLNIKNKAPLELYSLTKDVSDYAWYSTSIDLTREDLPYRPDVKPILQVASLGHALLAFVNGEYVGSAHGSNIDKSFVFKNEIKLNPGKNTITLLCLTVGLPNSGAYMEKRFAGPRAVTIQGLSAGNLDITQNNWGHEVGLKGEKDQVFTQEGANKVKWSPAITRPAVTWYKTYFESPEGKDPVALRIKDMGKGHIWINGNSIGRYWVNYLSPLKQPTQSEYHVPRAFLKPGKNMLVLFEEENNVKPENIEVVVVNRDTVCSFVSEVHPPDVESWEAKEGEFRPIVKDPRPGSKLGCAQGDVIQKIDFVSFGTPEGVCGQYSLGKCHSPASHQIVEKFCLGKNSCFVPVDMNLLGDACPLTTKTLAIQVTCGDNPSKKLGEREVVTFDMPKEEKE